MASVGSVASIPEPGRPDLRACPAAPAGAPRRV